MFSVKSIMGHDSQLVEADIIGDTMVWLASRGTRRWDKLLNRNEAIRTGIMYNDKQWSSILITIYRYLETVLHGK